MAKILKHSNTIYSNIVRNLIAEQKIMYEPVISIKAAETIAKLYAEAIIPPCIPDPEIVKVNWDNLRDKYFEECIIKYPSGSMKVGLAPHDMFEWFKKQITKNA